MIGPGVKEVKMKNILPVILASMVIAAPSLVHGENNDFGEQDRSVIDGLNVTDPDDTNDDAGESDGEESPGEETPGDEGVEVPEDEQDEAPLVGYEDQNLFLMLVQLFLALGVVLFLIYMLLRFMNNRTRSFQANRTIQTLGGTGVGQNRSVQIVRVGDRILVVGVGDTVQLLREITDPEEVERLSHTPETQDFYERPFSKLGSLLNKNRQENEPETQEQAFKSLLDREMTDVKDSQKKIHSAMEEKK